MLWRNSPASLWLSFQIVVLSLGALLYSTPLLATDTLSLLNPDPTAMGHSAGATLQSKGSFIGSATMDNAVGVGSSETFLLQDSELGSLGEDQALIERVNKYRLGLSYGVMERFQLGIGVTGSYENVGTTSRAQMGLLAGPEEDGSRQTDYSKNSFAGAQITMKIGLVQLPQFSLAAIPFIETGSGEDATYSVSRSVSSKGGWLAAMTIGNQDLVWTDWNVGYRYRKAENFGPYVLQNELFYNGKIGARLSQRFVAFAGASSRHLMIVTRTDSTDFNPSVANESQLGLRYELGSFKLSAYGGTGISEHRGLGYRRQHFGMSVSMALGSTRHQHKKPVFAEKVQNEVQQDKKMVPQRPLTAEEQWEVDRKAEKAQAEKQMAETLDFDTSKFDYLSGLKEADSKEQDDFAIVEMEAKEAEKDPNYGKPSEIEQIEDELAELKKAEKIAEEKRAQEEARQELLRQKEERQRIKRDTKLRSKWMKEANDYLNEVDGISDDQFDWDGLDEGNAGDNDPDLLQDSFGNSYTE